MRRLIALGAIACLGAFVFAQVRGTDMLADYAKALNGAKSMSATYSVQRVGDVATTYKVDLAKPDKARIDTPTQLVVADGKTITTYDKKDKSYFKKPETLTDLKGLFATDDLSLFGAFFDQNFYAGVPAAKAAGTKVRKGVTYNVVQANMDTKGKKVINFYLDPADKLAKVGEFTLNDAGATDTLLVMTKEFTVGGAQSSDTFAFAPPDGSREITLEELSAAKWYESFDEAMAAGKKLNKPVLVDFYADW